MNWCERNNVGYLLGLARNSVLHRHVQFQLDQSRPAGFTSSQQCSTLALTFATLGSEFYAT